MTHAGFTESWSEPLAEIPPESQDIYHGEEYHLLYTTAPSVATCFSYRDGERVFLLPFVKSPVFLPGEPEPYWDFESAYGYGGPVTNSSEPAFLQTAASEFCEHCRQSRIVCGLIRFHPLLANHTLLQGDARFSVEKDRLTVAIDLRMGAAGIWDNEIHSKHRNSIRKAQEGGLEFDVDEDFAGIECFQALYERTMDRRNADRSYYFSREYYKKLAELLKGRSCLCFVRDGRKIIAGAILFWGRNYGHYHLSGSEEGSLALSPNNFLLYRAALYLMGKGIAFFHLGGGTNRDPDNSLLMFKKRFSRSTHEFWIGKPVFIPSVYQELCERWQLDNPSRSGLFAGYLMRYRR